MAVLDWGAMNEAVGWYLFFSDWYAFASCGAESARFAWA
jgi:hypothetical protein